MVRSCVAAGNCGSTTLRFRAQRQARYLDFLEVHFYPLADAGGYKYRDAEGETRNLAYLENVVR